MNEQGMSQNGWIESPEHNADGDSLSALDVKITDLFPGVTVRKDLVNKVKGNALVPSYVLEFLLSAYATNTDQASIESGVDRVRAILANNYVHREEANLIQSKIREKGSHRIIDRVQVALNEKTDLYEATFSNLGISQVIVASKPCKGLSETAGDGHLVYVPDRLRIFRRPARSAMAVAAAQACADVA